MYTFTETKLFQSTLLINICQLYLVNTNKNLNAINEFKIKRYMI